jgi:phosphodiesterase/alkaline phosphatase D-like protein
MKAILTALALSFVLSAVVLAQSNSSNSSPYNQGSLGMASADQVTNGPVAETVSDSSAVIGWSSKIPANSATVKYGTRRDHLEESAEATQNSDSKNHHADLKGLAPSTTYYFQVMDNGQPVGGIGTFRTVAAGEKPMQSKAVISQK